MKPIAKHSEWNEETVSREGRVSVVKPQAPNHVFRTLLAFAAFLAGVTGSAHAWTDSTLTAGTTQVRKVHIDELRDGTSAGTDNLSQAIDGINDWRAEYGFTPFDSWTDATITANTTQVRKVHIDEMRDKLDDIEAVANYSTCIDAGNPTAWTDPTITAGSTGIRTVHITQLRTAMDGASTCGTCAPLCKTCSGASGFTNQSGTDYYGDCSDTTTCMTGNCSGGACQYVSNGVQGYNCTAAATSCSNADTCNGSGTCNANNLADGATCNDNVCMQCSGGACSIIIEANNDCGVCVTCDGYYYDACPPYGCLTWTGTGTCNLYVGNGVDPSNDCTSVCKACNGSGACTGNIPVNQDYYNECTYVYDVSNCPTSCSYNTGNCNGSGACQTYSTCQSDGCGGYTCV